MTLDRWILAGIFALVATVPPWPGPLASVASADDALAPVSEPESPDAQPMPAAEPPAAAAPEVASRVVHEVTVEGDLLVPASAGAEPMRKPIGLRARFVFTEQAAAAGGQRGTPRTYAVAAAAMEADGVSSRRLLGRDGRELLVAVRGTTASPYLADGFLSREEAELLDTPFDPLLIDGLRPEGPVAEGQSWRLDGDLAAGLLAIDTLASGGLEASLAKVEDDRATIRLAGTVTGAVDGAPTRLQIEGTAMVAAARDEAPSRWRLEGRVTELEATIKERREAGWVAPGLDVEARVVTRRAVLTTAANEARQADDLGPALADRPRGPGRPDAVWHRHAGGRYALVMDGRWRVIEDGPEGLVMRFVDKGALIAQCSIVPLPPTAADSPPTEDTVRADVRRSLADQFGHLAESDVSTREDGTRVVRVVVDGAAEGRPFRWIHHVLTDPAGHQAAVTFMMEPVLAERFAAADRELVAGLIVLREPPRRSAAADDAGRR